MDLTTGGGGHARAIAAVVGQQNLTLIDADPLAVSNLKQEFAAAKIYNNNFADQLRQFKDQGLAFDMILADLGLSSLQLNAKDRGFSFRTDGPLDMRFDNRQGDTLADLLERASAVELATILKDYGQEQAAERIAVRIKSQRPQTTLELARLISEVKGKHFRNRRLHPATKSFMAFRIWTNDELGQLRTLLATAPELLQPRGRLAVISFHSLEDRLVKHAFKDLADGEYSSAYFIKNKKPIIPSTDSLAAHPQARSAKLRVLQRL